ncbi:lysophospholipid acyltransferase family protein [Parasporobacterium paucivorans]|uniref:1-acyl-sn-glycerol-3-phosphate acyltransferase n=1 Tax=Parasporobacterium paucivorans DSM 15970 TaxID=1122934 RepID=A0A1M6BF27_9FIRM|nr:lysophospholipid acyltransferase family protein [Parasporobacterium paucivorans]SHI47341.1 1-acyl-sn-glycerol-3-phosphate acyltransferase [Parasporobacterium paucivorans DSM 15970]
MIRLIIALIFLLFFFVISLLLLILEWILGKISLTARHKTSLWIVQAVFKVILFISGTKVIVKGRENLLPDEAVLYVANHRGYFDIVVAYGLMPSLTGFIAKKEMEKIPLLYHWMRFLNCMFLDRKDTRQGLKTILEGIDKVRNGISVFIFPEGTRGESDLTPLPFKEGSFKIASKTGCPIIPVAISNTASVLKTHPLRLKKARVVIEFGKPFTVEQLSVEDQKSLSVITRNQIMDMAAVNARLT